MGRKKVTGRGSSAYLFVPAVPTACNTNNHHEYAPFVVDGLAATVDPTWFGQLTGQAREEIESSGAQLTLAPVECPHPHVDSPLFWVVYAAYNRQYDHHRWHPLVAGWMARRGDLVVMVPLAPADLEALVESAAPTEPTRAMLMRAVQTLYPAFVKTDTCSGKNTHPLTECREWADVLDRLTRAAEHATYYRRCLDRDGRGWVVVQRWRDEIDASNEYRAIVHGGRVRAISQQKWYKQVYRSEAELARVADLVVRAWDELSRLLPFQDVVLDLWVEAAADDNLAVHLIECNPGGRWASSGSSLFHWVNDDVENLDRPTIKWF